MPLSLLESISVSAFDGFCTMTMGIRFQQEYSRRSYTASLLNRQLLASDTKKIPLIIWPPLLQLSFPPPTSATHSHGHDSTLSLSTIAILLSYCSQTGLPASPLLLQSILSAAARAIKQSQILSLLLKSSHLTESTRQSPYKNMQGLTRPRHLLFLQSHLLLLPIAYSDPTTLIFVCSHSMPSLRTSVIAVPSV